MSRKVLSLEQEVERLTDGGELENVSPFLTQFLHWTPYLVVNPLRVFHFIVQLRREKQHLESELERAEHESATYVTEVREVSRNWAKASLSSSDVTSLSHAAVTGSFECNYWMLPNHRGVKKTNSEHLTAVSVWWLLTVPIKHHLKPNFSSKICWLSCRPDLTALIQKLTDRMRSWLW